MKRHVQILLSCECNRTALRDIPVPGVYMFRLYAKSIAWPPPASANLQIRETQLLVSAYDSSRQNSSQAVRRPVMAVDSFFEGSSSGKRKRGGVKASNGAGGSAQGARRGGGRVNGSHASYKGKGRAQEEAPRRNSKINDEEIEESDEDDGDNDEDIDGGIQEEFESDTEADRRETPAQKRLRLAQQYLDSLKAAQEGKL